MVGSRSVPGHSLVGHGRFMMSVPDVSPQFQSPISVPDQASSPRGDATEVPVGRDAVPKTRQKNALPREDATEVLVGKVVVPKGVHSTVYRPVRHRFGAGLLRGDGSGIPVSKVAVPKGALAELIEL